MFIHVETAPGFDWRKRGARLHPWKHVPPVVFKAACEELDSIIAL